MSQGVWKGSAIISESFLDCLRKRRQKQARVLLRRFGSILRSGRVIDYGCGQGELVAFLRQHEIDCVGADIDTTYASQLVDKEYLVQLHASEVLPPLEGFSTLIMCDVIEHIKHPYTFLRQIAEQGIKNILIKTPLVNGPIALVAKALFQIGSPGTLEKLFQVGDPYPHVWFFSEKGICRMLQRAAYQPVDKLLVAEVGSDLPNRIRSNRHGSVFSTAVLKAFGFGLETLAPVWSDTGFFLFRESPAISPVA